jgi:arylsulfatase A
MPPPLRRLRGLVAFFAAGVLGLATASPPPNVVIFLADDLGWGDLGCQGNPVIRTPHLDAFAAQSVRLTQCYAGAGLCSPSRAALLTGRTPYRNGVFTWIPEREALHLRASEITLPTLLRAAGYATAHAGKWHLNSHFNAPTQPQLHDHGYAWWLATQNNAAPSHDRPVNFVRNGRPVGRIDTFSGLFVAGEAVAWLTSVRDPAKPFFLTVWPHEPHHPIKSAPEFHALYRDLADRPLAEYAANVSQLDAVFGRITRALDALGLAENTVVIFSSDNGPEGDGLTTEHRGSTGGLRGRKRSLYEGGIRVPGLVRWPGLGRPGTTSDVPVIHSDFLPTLALAAGVRPPGDRVLDGGDFRPALAGRPVARPRPLYWRCAIASEPMKIALRDGDWKLLADEELTQFELYNVQHDRTESRPLGEKHPEKLRELQQRLRTLNAEIEAEGPAWWRGYNHPWKPKPAPPSAR